MTFEEARPLGLQQVSCTKNKPQQAPGGLLRGTHWDLGNFHTPWQRSAEQRRVTSRSPSTAWLVIDSLNASTWRH